MHIFVGSTNPVKVNAVVLAASETWPEVMVRGVEVASGVSLQPMSDAETRLGASNRARAALDTGVHLGERTHLFFDQTAATSESNSERFSETSQVLGIGLEGGVFQRENGELWSTVWVAVADLAGTVAESNGARFKIPDRIAQPILAGGEMGPIMDALLSSSNTKQAGGAIGVITRNFVDRTEEYTGIAKMALGLWYGREWQKDL
jgi:non-canonical (house-cleaning) NTP pyrophosphatase